MEDIEVTEDKSIPLAEQSLDPPINASCSSDQGLMKSLHRKKKRGVGKFHHRVNDRLQKLNVKGNVKMKNKKCKKKFLKKLSGPLLRPVGSEVPQAPNNSTQFIMDNHENSSLFVDFSDGPEPKIREADGSSPFQPADWFPYNVADFNCTYRSAREDKLMTTISSFDIKAAVIAMEGKVALLSDQLSASPSRLLANLQSQLLSLQEENKRLHAQAERLRKDKCLCTSSSSATSSSTSTSSSSDSSSDSDDSSGSSSSESSEENCSPGQHIQKEDLENTLFLCDGDPDSSLS